MEALLTDLAGNRTAGEMLLLLIQWWPSATNPNGWVYKSRKDWWAELRIPPNQLPKLNEALSHAGVDIELKMANGAPQKHYRLNFPKFIERIHTCLGLSVPEIERIMDDGESLRQMPYSEYLKTEHWQNVRRSAIQRAGGRCQVCNSGKVQLNVHHRTYENRGREQNADVIVLCSDCHHLFHANGKVQS